MGRINELRLIARVAQMYHVEGKRQAEIAETMRMSQATVSRMLKRAQGKGHRAPRSSRRRHLR